ncbi:hypothetical protein lbkm_2143 [Lachnospiraceae bacterium KM106-2]|nr:hypothetical protein lbkm_2143 [Lachnospiraceae bacterium KM106-2]
MGAIYFMIVMTILFLLLSIHLLRGKGANLIAGYNTSSEKEKAKYDELKLCRCTGVSMLITTISLAILTYFCYLVEIKKMAEHDMFPISMVFCAVVLITVVVSIIYSDTKCLKKDQ